MVNNSRLIKVIVLIISLSSINAQSNAVNNSFWIYTYSSEMKDYQINDIENDQLVLNNGSWDIKIPIAEIELIALPPKPGLLGQILGGFICGYGGLCVGFIAGSIIFGYLPFSGRSEETEKGVLAVGITSLLAGAYYGSKLGGGFLKGEPEIIADLGFMTLAEKKEYIQTNLIY